MLGTLGRVKMEEVIFGSSEVAFRSARLLTGRRAGRDIILARGAVGDLAGTGLTGGEPDGEGLVFPADYANMLAWERELAPVRRLVALNRGGYQRGFGAGNRIVVAWQDLPSLREPTTFGGWDGIYSAMRRGAVPFWFVQQSIVRELIPEGADPERYPGIGHTGGYGPRELLRAGLFAFAGQGGYTRCELPIGADADHAIVTGHDEGSLAESLALNKLAMAEAAGYTKFTVDTSQLFDFPVDLGPGQRRRLLAAFRGPTFRIPNVLAGRPALEFRFDEEETLRLGRKYWRACAVHKELYDHAAALRGGRPFDYELSLDETPAPTPPRHLLFYLVLLGEVMGLPAGGVASAGPNIGFVKRHDYEGDLQGELWPQVNASASILQHFGAMLSVHSADGVQASTGKGPGVDAVIAAATGGQVELKVADVYQEVLWQVLAASEDAAERELFLEAGRRTYEAVRQLAAVYQGELAGREPQEAARLLVSTSGREGVARRYGAEAARLALGVIGYGLPVFRLAADLVARTDPACPAAEVDLFRRFMFLPYRELRPLLFRTLTRRGWERLSGAVEEATLVRLRAMGWTR